MQKFRGYWTNHIVEVKTNKYGDNYFLVAEKAAGDNVPVIAEFKDEVLPVLTVSGTGENLRILQYNDT